MGRAEYAALGSLATGLATGYGAERERRQKEKYAKRQDWLQCIMSGDSAEACAQITGYQPESQEAEGAVQFQSEAEARKRVGEERKAIGKLSPEEYTVAHTRTIPGQDITMRSRLATGEIGSTVMGQTKEKEIYLPDLGPIEDYRGALARAGEKREVAKKRGELSEKLATEERSAKEKRSYREFREKFRRGDTDLEKKTKKWLSERGKEDKEKEKQRNKVEDYVIKWNKAWAEIQEVDPLVLLEKGKAPEAVTKLERKQKAPLYAFNEWAKGNVPKRYRNAVRDAAGVEKRTPVTSPGAGPQNEEAAYNACREAGGTMEECKAKLGIQ